MIGISKALALQALKACGGDVSAVGLRRTGLTWRETTTLGKVLDGLGCTTKGGIGSLRSIVDSLEEAVARVESIEDDELQEPELDDDVTPEFSVTHDPHDIYGIGEPITRFGLLHLTRMSQDLYPDVNGLEVCDGKVKYRIYHGRLYLLQDGEMIETRQ